MANPMAAIADAASRTSELANRVGHMIRAERGDDVGVINFGIMEDGHAGLTFGFDTIARDGAPLGSYVIKVAPAGVARRGNTDVYRQAPLLRALKDCGLPVPEIPWASADEELLGTPFIVMEKMPGRVFLVWEPHQSFPRDAEFLRDIWLQGARLLAQVHRVDWKHALPNWEAPRLLDEERDRWTYLLRHAESNPDWHAAGTRLGAALLAGQPKETSIGVIHGDFQPGNILYENGKAGGLIDWELASIGPQGLDVGWMMMMVDSGAWSPDWQPVTSVGSEEIVAAYREAGGPAVNDLDWYQALAQYRLGTIACLNVKLHRTGKRRDELWERFAPSIPFLFERGTELAERAIQQGKKGKRA